MLGDHKEKTEGIQDVKADQKYEEKGSANGACGSGADTRADIFRSDAAGFHEQTYDARADGGQRRVRDLARRR